ncbi:hypothetical protein [Paraburkholderia phenazinium]|uniref:hypothetical protein n=1 Tax=Paraburkholderia phenazinium TaxID=60549 RepID=UPI000B8259F9|nr:hypothetical protein [Paraburkholderia phenazinium]
MIAFHEVAGGDVAEVRGRCVGGATRVSVQRVGGDQMGDGAKLVTGSASRVGERSMLGRVERESLAAIVMAGWVAAVLRG